MIRFSHEKKRESFILASMSRSSDFINSHELVDLPLGGRRFTWTNNQERVAMSRIDHFMLSKEWKDHFPVVIQVALPIMLSDHCPIKLSTKAMDWGPIPFRFENCWLLHKKLIPMVRDY